MTPFLRQWQQDAKALADKIEARNTASRINQENTRERMSGLDLNPSCPICECGEKCRNMCGE